MQESKQAGERKMKKTGASTSGVFTIKEYMMEEGMGIPELILRLDAGPEKVQEIISYVFEGDDPMQLDAKSFSVSPPNSSMNRTGISDVTVVLMERMNTWFSEWFAIV